MHPITVLVICTLSTFLFSFAKSDVEPGYQYHIRVYGGVEPQCRSLVSAYPDGTNTELASNDDGTGRQLWRFEAIPRVPDLFYIRVDGGISNNRSLLSSPASGWGDIELWPQDDNTGRQKWYVRPISGTDSVYHVISAGPTNYPYNIMSTPADGIHVDMWVEDEGSGRQKWVISKRGFCF
ncbi:ricin-type beta-trefoil lectin domain protein [Pelomyxa schiedti]|nr:ricin-type beta-trefoil lectin domain protein [Pelomyxa schiedti]